MKLPKLSLRTAAAMAAIAMAGGLLGCSSSRDGDEPALALSSAAPHRIAGMRRLTEAQYRNVIGDIFGEDIKVGGRFDPIVRPDRGLIAVAASQSAVSPAGFEQFDVMARTIAGQVLDEQHRPAFLSCQPADPTKADPDCARAFFLRVGPLLYRRPLTSTELQFYVALSGRGAAPGKDFNEGLRLGLAAMLISPEFLYRVESLAPDGKELDGFSKASQLSFFLWNSGPDAPLLAAAARGELDTPKGLQAQVDRMVASPKLEQGARAFFTDFLQLDRVSDLSKDTVVYKRFTQGVATDLTEQTLLTVVDHLLTQDKPYPELFTTRRIFMNRRLALLYQAPVLSPKGWEAYEIPADEDRAGLLGQGAFLAQFAHEGRSSPTLRGRAIREVLMCQPIPNPPANVDFTGFNDTSNAVLKTARQRLSHHVSNPVCASCHNIMDPLGLPLERFDGIGADRDMENGVSIDASGKFDGKPFVGEAAFGYLLSQSPVPSRCLTQRAAEYATGATKLPAGWVDGLFKDFQAGGFKYRTLVERIALSPQFYAGPDAKTPPAKVAQLGSNSIRTNEDR